MSHHRVKFGVLSVDVPISLDAKDALKQALIQMGTVELLNDSCEIFELTADGQWSSKWLLTGLALVNFVHQNFNVNDFDIKFYVSVRPKVSLDD